LLFGGGFLFGGGLCLAPAGLATEAPGLVAVAYPPAQFKLSRTSSVTDCT